MGKIVNIERQVEELSQPELVKFREWFARFDAEVWDRQFEADVKVDKFNALAERVLEAHWAGKQAS